jgi:hypothetical protein
MKRVLVISTLALFLVAYVPSAFAKDAPKAKTEKKDVKKCEKECSKSCSKSADVKETPKSNPSK